jgi:hypothetical protein
LTDTEAEQLGRDPFLIAYALADAANRTVVTSEVSKPTLTRQNRRVPDVCKTMGAKQCDPFAFNRALKFSTQWKKVSALLTPSSLGLPERGCYVSM